MAQRLSAEELRTAHLAALGSELGPAFHALHNELAWLHLKWEQYVELYGTRPERLGLLNTAAPLFFRIVQDSLWEDTLLHLSRLTDPAESPGKSKRTNLTVCALPKLVLEPALRSRMDDLVARAVESTAFARDWRNRHLAHRDLALALGQATHPLAEASRRQVEEALSSLCNVLNAISIHFRQTTVVYDFAGHPGGAQSVLRKLSVGLNALRAQRERSERGTRLPEDLELPPAI